jgi:cytochrome P450 family 110
VSLPNPVRLPAVGQTLLWALWPTRSLDHFAARLGEPFTVRLIGGRTYLVVSSPDAVREVLTAFPDACNEELRPFLGDHSLFLLRGEPHAAHRRLIQPPFQGSPAVGPHGDRIRDLTRRAVEGYRPGDRVDVVPLVQRVTAEVITDVVLGSADGPRAAEIRELLLWLTNLVSGPVMFIDLLQRDLGRWSPGRRIGRLMRAADRAVREEIDARRPGGPDVVTRLRDLPAAELLDETKTLLVAGQDPTATAVAWALYWIHANPAVRDRLHDELGGGPAEFDAAAVGLDGDSYLDRVCRETLRILPVVPAADRVLYEPADFMGHRLEAGTRLAACAYLTHRRPDIFEDPLTFRPERFAGRRYSPFEYYPFGGGRRRCIGAFFAVFQMKVMLAALLRTLAFEAPFAGRVKIVPRNVSLAPSRALRLTVRAVAR